MRRSKRIRGEFVAAKKIWPQAVHGIKSEQLEVLLRTYRFSVKRGDLQLLGGRWYVTHIGLLGLAARMLCCGVHTETVGLRDARRIYGSRAAAQFDHFNQSR